MKTPTCHVSALIRIWVASLVVLLAVSSTFAPAIVLSGWMRPAPFLWLSIAAAMWLIGPRRSFCVSFTSSLIAVGLCLRALEVLLFAGELFPFQTRVTIASMWMFVATTTLLIGLLDATIVRRRAIEP